MRISDVAVLELGATRRDLHDLSSYSLGDPPSAGDPIEAVGVPTTGIPPDEWFLRASPCTARATVRLVEGKWLWDAAGSSDCPGILGGSSGSPVFAADDPSVAVGIVNTTTISAPPGGSCAVGRPCELSTGRAVEVADRSYFMPLATWEACWAPSVRHRQRRLPGRATARHRRRRAAAGGPARRDVVGHDRERRA